MTEGPSKSERGAALVIVLCMVVLLSTLILAFFSKTVLEHQISSSSSNQVKVDLFAQGAVDQILGDLKKEIVVGSNTPYEAKIGATVYETIYTPKTIAGIKPGAIPALVVPATYSALWKTQFKNLVKQSAYGQPFYPSSYGGTGPNRAANLSSSEESLNGRSVSVTKWNKPLLLPKKNLNSTDITPPDGNTEFKSPDWILVARDGGNPTSWNNNLKTPNSNDYVVGRYAYTMYNEGGLLDANTAGSPLSLMNSDQQKVWSGKGSQAFAKLTLTGLNASQINALVGWRNYSSASYNQTTGSSSSIGTFPSYSSLSGGIDNYLQFLSLTSGSVTPQSSAIVGDSTDQVFTSRQQMLDFFNSVATEGNNNLATTQNALQYLGTFNRSLNRPEYVPEATRPTVTSGAATSTTYTGGNSARNKDDAYNPAFLKLRVPTQFTRSDGSIAKQGDPLVSKRFPLDRLSWLTCKGPSANLPASDPIIQYFLGQGIPQRTLSQGTDTNIRAQFGLDWHNGSSSYVGGYWQYVHGFGSYVGTLDDVLNAPTKRDPNFFELLQAAVAAGSVAKGFTSPWSALDTYVDFQILQMGANIIDQFNPDSYPTQIRILDGGVTRRFYGSEDLPYVNALHEKGFVVKDSVPAAPATAIKNNDVITTGNEGQAVFMLIPSIWNPYQRLTADPRPAAVKNLAPNQLRITIIQTDPYNTVTPGSNPFRPRVYYPGETPPVTNPPTPPIPAENNPTQPTSDWVDSDSTAMYFTNGQSTTALYREPTLLWRPTLPAGSNLQIKSGNVISKATTGDALWTTGIPEYNGPIYVGFYAGKFPFRWMVGSKAYISTYVYSSYSAAKATVRMEYEDGSGNWIPYQERWIGSNTSPQTFYPGLMLARQTGSGPDTSVSGASNYSWDPRSPRWGQLADVFHPSLSDGSTTLYTFRPTASSGRPSHVAPPGAGWWAGSNDSGTAGTMSPGMIVQNIKGTVNTDFHYQDPDGVIRRGMASFASGTTGQPLVPTTGNLNRPVMLHRPFKTVSELGYVFSGTPWKNIDFFNPESGYTALLDVFCVHDDMKSDALITGKVDLNTRQSLVLQSLLAGGYQEEWTAVNPASGPSGTNVLSDSDAKNIADGLITRTTSNLTGKGPLTNIGDVVGRYTGTVVAANNGQPFDGFSADLSTLYPSGNANLISVQRFRENALRSLSDTGQAGVWNLMIDVIAQTGRYPGSATQLKNFQVEGERRYWVHLAIDRRTGVVLDRQIEQVNE